MLTKSIVEAPSEAALSASQRPEFYRLPKRGGDPYFNLTRSWYYQAEKHGLLTLVRLRQRGRRRGVTLVSFNQIAALIHKQMEVAK
jgi:hypothetical protein